MRKYTGWLALAAGALAFGLAGWLLASVVPKAAGKADSAAAARSQDHPAAHRAGLAGRDEGGSVRDRVCPGHPQQPGSAAAVACPLSVTTTSLPGATLGARYSVQMLAAGGGTPRYTWAVEDRWLPPGLSLSPAGVISGSPVLAGTFDFTVRAADPTGDSAATSLSVTVGGCTKLITGRHDRPLTIGAGVTCLDQATISGPVAVTPGAVVSIRASTLGGPLSARSPARLAVCGSTVSGPAQVTGAAGPVLLGGTSGTPCPANAITGLVTLTGDTGGVTLDGATISGPAHITGNAGPVTVIGNTISGPASITGNTGGTVVAGNSVNGSLFCSGNTPAPSHRGVPNTSSGPATGQCADLT
jgi:Putative Ig domain